MISYSNVVATLALFVALGGASYAAVVLPINSVGPSQLRPHAVTRRALGIPISASSRTDRASVELLGGFCNGWPLPPGQPAPPCTPRPKGGPTPGREVSVVVPAPATLVILATVGLTNPGPPSTRATVTIETTIDGRAVAERATVVDGNDATQATVQGAFALPRGRHVVGIGLSARYSARGPNVLAGPTTLTAMAFPH